ncbi:hypothetical protein ADUPG1_010333 [Aduncisulcus paluster]|uniref:Uncharacterized protein n=1 Tax=Aduncisulcus paluster TaxID=2918883 RepID=A0ABQ5JTH2_9EUKA|nr:hypothetical protein ADUPG1_010333 [Aduncisulcus paluster]
MVDIPIICARSDLSKGDKSIEIVAEKFLASLKKEISDFSFSIHWTTGDSIPSSFFECKTIILFPITGGTEDLLISSISHSFPILKANEPGQALQKDPHLIVYGNSLRNSLPSATEISYFLKRFGKLCSLTHSIPEVYDLIIGANLMQISRLRQYRSKKIGLIGEISPWLVNEKIHYGFPVVDQIPLTFIMESLETLRSIPAVRVSKSHIDLLSKLSEGKEPDSDALTDSVRILAIIRQLQRERKWDIFTIGCFKLLDAPSTPVLPCLAVSALEAICEGEVSTCCLSLLLNVLSTNRSGVWEGEQHRSVSDESEGEALYRFGSPFMCNLQSYSAASLTLAHCTAPMPSLSALSLCIEKGASSEQDPAHVVDMEDISSKVQSLVDYDDSVGPLIHEVEGSGSVEKRKTGSCSTMPRCSHGSKEVCDMSSCCCDCTDHSSVLIPTFKDVALRSHFESGLSVAVSACLGEGECFVIKLRTSPFNSCVMIQGSYKGVKSDSVCDTCCRTQVVVTARNSNLFAQNGLGNHSLVVPVSGSVEKAKEDILQLLQASGCIVSII